MSSKKVVRGLRAEAVFDRRIGLIKITITNESNTTIFVEAVKIFYTRIAVMGIVVAILLLMIIIIGMLYHTGDVVSVVNTLLTLGAIVIGILGRKLGQKTIAKNLRVLMGIRETYTVTIPLERKPSSIEVYTNKGVIKPRIKEIIIRPKVVMPRHRISRRTSGGGRF